MAIIDKMLAPFGLQRRNAASVTETAASSYTYSVMGGFDTVSSKEMALRIATVYRCADILSKGVAQLPLEIRRNDGGYFVDDVNDIFGLSYLMLWQPNERLDAFEFKRNIVLQMLFQGNAYIYPEWGRKEYKRLVLLAPGTVSYDVYNNRYVVNDNINGVSGTFEAKDIIHVKNLGTDGGYNGMSTLKYAGSVLAISANADTQNVETFKNGGLVRGFVSGKGGQTVGFGSIQDSQLKSTADNIEAQLLSGKNVFNLPGEMSFNQLSLSPKDIELLSTKQFNVLEICRFFGVHPDKVFAQQSTNYKASEMSQVSFLTDSLQPYLQQITKAMQVKLIPKRLINQYQIAFDIELVMQTDLQTQADFMTKTIASGSRTVNYWRKKLGQAPVQGGDEPLVSANLVPLNSAKLRGEATQNN